MRILTIQLIFPSQCGRSVCSNHRADPPCAARCQGSLVRAAYASPASSAISSKQAMNFHEKLRMIIEQRQNGRSRWGAALSQAEHASHTMRDFHDKLPYEKLWNFIAIFLHIRDLPPVNVVVVVVALELSIRPSETTFPILGWLVFGLVEKVLKSCGKFGLLESLSIMNRFVRRRRRLLWLVCANIIVSVPSPLRNVPFWVTDASWRPAEDAART